jgi:hypothetical protein
MFCTSTTAGYAAADGGGAGLLKEPTAAAIMIRNFSLTLGVVPVPNPGQRGCDNTADQAGALGRVVQPSNNMLHVQIRKEQEVEIF